MYTCRHLFYLISQIKQKTAIDNFSLVQNNNVQVMK